MAVRSYLQDYKILADNMEPYTTEPVTVDELKNFLQIEGTAYDSSLTIFIKSTRQKIEKYCNVSLVSKNIRATFLTTGRPEMKLPFPPVDTVTTVTYKDCCDWEPVEEGESGYCLGDDYIVSAYTGKHQVTYTTTQDLNNMDSFRQAILMQAGWLFTQRDEPNVPEWNPQAKAVIEELVNRGV